MKLKITRASKGKSEGRSAWYDGTPQKLLPYFNNFNNTNFTYKDKLQLHIKIGNTIFKFNGHFNKSRGDFYIGVKEWKKIANIEFQVGNEIECDLIDYSVL